MLFYFYMACSYCCGFVSVQRITVGAGHARDILAAMLGFSFFIAGMARSYNA
ncbi:MAG: hypothetical protein WCS87_07835 [Methylococcaceae bacterium]